jgi:hypothetical protein
MTRGLRENFGRLIQRTTVATKNSADAAMMIPSGDAPSGFTGKIH